MMDWSGVAVETLLILSAACVISLLASTVTKRTRLTIAACPFLFMLHPTTGDGAADRVIMFFGRPSVHPSVNTYFA